MPEGSVLSLFVADVNVGPGVIAEHASGCDETSRVSPTVTATVRHATVTARRAMLEAEVCTRIQDHKAMGGAPAPSIFISIFD